MIAVAFLLAVVGVADTLDLHKAVAENRVTAVLRGAGLQEVRGTLTRVGPPLVVRIPIGTYFVTEDDAQDMVATRTTMVSLAAVRRAAAVVPVACADIDLPVPDGEIEFTVEAPEPGDLAAVLPVLSRAAAGFDVTQAAVWILTGDAVYEQLGTLVGGVGGFGSRRINEPEAARALMLIEQARVDITGFGIWEDREDICQEVLGTPGATATWCRRILRETDDLEWMVAALADARRPVRDLARGGLARMPAEEVKAQLLQALEEAAEWRTDTSDVLDDPTALSTADYDRQSTAAIEVLCPVAGNDVTVAIARNATHPAPRVRAAASACMQTRPL